MAGSCLASHGSPAGERGDRAKRAGYRTYQPPSDAMSMPFRWSFPVLPGVTTGILSITSDPLHELSPAGVGEDWTQKPRLAVFVLSRQSCRGSPRFSYEFLVLSPGAVRNMCILSVVRKSVRLGSGGAKPISVTMTMQSGRLSPSPTCASARGTFSFIA